MTIDFPWHLDGTGRTASTTADDHVRDLIEQVLLTSPGERVMRPDFGAGLLAMVFEPGGQAAAATAQYLVQGALERTLGEVIAVESVDVAAEGMGSAAPAPEGALVVTVVYQVRRTGARETATFTTPGGGA
ncbi:GPW/gp25 family protein [Kribbia dieselivorans]|uniref:GPW/gp25 family protein n=1 Tax=Kribbia dieselivorans TaxID=331526 RepID=UPI000838D0EA|nr:GPW/gp25 family protein [Kribbia dieselivorans]